MGMNGVLEAATSCHISYLPDRRASTSSNSDLSFPGNKIVYLCIFLNHCNRNIIFRYISWWIMPRIKQWYKRSKSRWPLQLLQIDRQEKEKKEAREGKKEKRKRRGNEEEERERRNVLSNGKLPKASHLQRSETAKDKSCLATPAIYSHTIN